MALKNVLTVDEAIAMLPDSETIEMMDANGGGCHPMPRESVIRQIRSAKSLYRGSLYEKLGFLLSCRVGFGDILIRTNPDPNVEIKNSAVIRKFK